MIAPIHPRPWKRCRKEKKTVCACFSAVTLDCVDSLVLRILVPMVEFSGVKYSAATITVEC